MARISFGDLEGIHRVARVESSTERGKWKESGISVAPPTRSKFSAGHPIRWTWPVHTGKAFMLSDGLLARAGSKNLGGYVAANLGKEISLPMGT